MTMDWLSEEMRKWFKEDMTEDEARDMLIAIGDRLRAAGDRIRPATGAVAESDERVRPEAGYD